MKKGKHNVKKLRYALIGCGRISPNHLAAMLLHKDQLELAALCDLHDERIDALLATQPELSGVAGKVPRYTDYMEMLDRVQPELTAIATHSGNHAEIALNCLEAGSHILIEKPMALSLADARAIIELGEAKGLIVAVAHQNRFNKSVVKIREAVEAGRFGRLLHGAATVRWNRGQDYYDQADWRGTWADDGGCLMNQCIHNIDLLRWMMGDEMTEVMAATDNLAHPGIEAEDIGLAICRFANGALGLIEGTTNVFPKNLEETLYIFGDKGTVKAGGKSVNTIDVWRFADGLDDPEAVMTEYHEDPPTVYGYGHNPLYTDVIDAITEGRKPLVDGEAGYRALELVLAMYRSQKERRPVKLPMDDFSTMDMTGIFDRQTGREQGLL